MNPRLTRTMSHTLSRRAFCTGIASLGVGLLSGCVAIAAPENAADPVMQTDSVAEPVTLPTVTPSAVTPQTVAGFDISTLLRPRGTAPELSSQVWLNSEPLQLADLRGKVVMVEFWTFGCINCRHVIPALQAWHDTYADDGLVIIGVHTPEFAYEHDVENVRAALGELGVTWPVAMDNEHENWRAYANHYWPAMYLVDKQGQIRYLKIGEGQYDVTEAALQALLMES